MINRTLPSSSLCPLFRDNRAPIDKYGRLKRGQSSRVTLHFGQFSLIRLRCRSAEFKASHTIFEYAREQGVHRERV